MNSKNRFYDKQDENGIRHKTRCAVSPGSFVIFKKSSIFGFMKPRVVKSANIIDINLQGLRAEYQAKDIWSSKFDRVAIVNEKDDVNICNIPATIISDFNVERLDNGTYIRQCGIKFGHLTASHESGLINFIQTYAIDPNEKRAWHIQFA